MYKPGIIHVVANALLRLPKITKPIGVLNQTIDASLFYIEPLMIFHPFIFVIALHLWFLCYTVFIFHPLGSLIYGYKNVIVSYISPSWLNQPHKSMVPLKDL
jgi:hypothetical protein